MVDADEAHRIRADDRLCLAVGLDRAVDIILDNEAVRTAVMARTAEMPPGKQYLVGLASHGVDTSGDARSCRGRYELVHVDQRHPVTVATEDRYRMIIGGGLSRMFRPVQQSYASLKQIGSQYVGGAVAAAIIVKIEMLDAAERMKFDPLGKIASLVPDDRRDRQEEAPGRGHGARVRR